MSGRPCKCLKINVSDKPLGNSENVRDNKTAVKRGQFIADRTTFCHRIMRSVCVWGRGGEGVGLIHMEISGYLNTYPDIWTEGLLFAVLIGVGNKM